MRLFAHASPFAVVALALAASPAPVPKEVAPGVQIVKAAAIAAKIENAAPSPGGRGGVVTEDEAWRLHATERDAPGLAERHEGDTDVWYVIAGGATLVTGGTIVDAKTTAPGELRGPSIQGGNELAVAAGDFVTIRPGVPHWLKAVDGRIRYLTIKVHSAPSAAAAR